jgi:hypothetical protein
MAHNIGFKTEGAWVSADVSVASAGQKTFTITHDLGGQGQSLTPSEENIYITLHDGSTPPNDSSTLRSSPPRVTAISSTTITVKMHVTAAGEASSELKCSAMVKQNF